MKRVATPMGERARALNGWRRTERYWIATDGCVSSRPYATRAEATDAARAWNAHRAEHPDSRAGLFSGEHHVARVTRWARRRAG